MKKYFVFLLCFHLMLTKASAQIPPQQLVKTTWSLLFAKYGPVAKKGEVTTFDMDGKHTLWPIWVRDISDTEELLSKDWVDAIAYHYNAQYWPSMRKLFNLATRFPTTRITSFADGSMTANEKEIFTNAVVERFGSTQNIYAVTNEGQNPMEYMTAFFYVKGGSAKFIGYFAHPFVD
ncbi:MAG: hypothetical protein ACKO6Q_04355 [Bacteroidota bacterium]